jgi:hypothetical protein
MGMVPNLSFLKIRGYEAFVRQLMPDKIDSKSDKSFFIDYPRKIKRYYIYYRLDNKVFVVRHGVFLEEEFHFKEYSGSNITLEEIQDPLSNVSGQTEVE